MRWDGMGWDRKRCKTIVVSSDVVYRLGYED